MCGIFGYINKNMGTSRFANQKSLAAIGHRGPDDQGEWKDEQYGVYLSQVRLSIVDLSEAGHQPMHSHSGRYVITLNGEIYNHKEIRLELDRLVSIKWRGHSDTEIFLEAIAYWGLEIALEKATGMFAFALWDRDRKRIALVRDRMGEKPLYYGWQGETFLFASDLAAIEEHQDFQGEIDREALSLFIQFSYIPAPWSIYRSLYKLEPGRIFYLDLAANNITEIKTYWSVASVIKRTSADDLREPSEIVNELEILLKRSISQQMLADVPIGAFLSGGIDSSTIVAIMQDLSDRPIRTFTIGFDSKKYNEAEHAKLVASYLKTDHTELYISGKETLDVIPSLAMSYSEPFGDSSQIPTTLVSKLARSKVTVALTGDAGDELFCGYKSYLIAENLRSNILKLPKWLRQCVYDINGWFSFASFSRSLSYKVDVAGKIFAADNDVDIYQRMISRTRKTDQYVLESTVDFNIGEKITDIQRQLEYIEKLMAIDLQMYLPDNNLCKVDRASMAFSLETRVPLLDHNIVDFAVNLPLKFKLYQGKSKWPLRQLLYRYVPQSIVERPKMGFSVPLSEWLSGPLRAWAESLLAKDKLVEQGYLNADLVKKTWHDHISRRRNNSHLLWNIIMFQSWLEIRKQKIS